MIVNVFSWCLLSTISVSLTETTGDPGSVINSYLNQPNEEKTISAEKCKEYKEFAFTNIIATNGMNNVQRSRIPNCGKPATAVVVGGETARINEFPHMALIGYQANTGIAWTCGGTLISERFVLSAAHCKSTYESLCKCGDSVFFMDDVKHFKDYEKHCKCYNETYPASNVMLGEHDISVEHEVSSSNSQIVNTIPHPEYDPPYRDILLFQLKDKVKFSAAIRPACLPEKFTELNQVIALGWGRVEYNGSRSSTLLKVNLDIFSNEECEKHYKNSYKNGMDKQMLLCTGSHNESKDTCSGDSGGPVFINHETYDCTYTVVALTSRGIGCGIRNVPAVNTRIYGYLNWIEQIVWPNESSVNN